MTEPKGRRFSRRDLFGVFGRGARSFRESIEREAPALAPGAARRPAPSVHRDRRLRPPDDTVPALPEEPGVWGVDLRRRPLGVATSLRVVGKGLAEPLLLVRVAAAHFAVTAGECPVDGSDLLWVAFEDRVGCPSCGSRWRLDGHCTRGPSDCDLASFPAQESGGLVRVRGPA